MESESSSNHARLIQRYFDEHAESWHDYYQGEKSLTHIVLIERKQIALSFMNRFLPPQPGTKVMDAGCGSGLIAIELAQLGYQVEGWDISEEMINLSQANFAAAAVPANQYALKTGNLLSSDLAPASFGGIMALGFLQYQFDEAEALQTLHRLLQPGGVLVLSGPVKVTLANYFGLANWLKRRKRPAKPAAGTDDHRQRDMALLHTISANAYSLARFRALLRAANFEMVSYRGHGFVHFKYLSRWLPYRQQRRLHRLLTKASDLLPIQRFGNDMVVVARKGTN